MLSRTRDLQKPVGKEMQKFVPFQEFVKEPWSEVRLKVSDSYKAGVQNSLHDERKDINEVRKT